MQINLIEFRNVTKNFQLGEEKFSGVSDVSFFIPAGQIFGIIGQTGAGKSTLMRFINLLESPDSGSIYFQGKEITKLKGKELRNLRSNVGMVFQQFHLLSNSTVYDNIALPLKAAGWQKDKIQSRVLELLELVGIPEKRNSYPNELSGGQKQRVGIARALANHPSLVLCDEPTSALDPETTASILSLLKRINRDLGVTILIVTHEMEVVRDICDSVVVMENGKVAELGSTYSLFADPKVAITKKMTGSILFPKLPPEVYAKTKGVIFSVLFKGSIANDPILTNVIRQVNVDLNILMSNIEYISGRPIGVFYIEVMGKKEDVLSAKDTFSRLGAEIEEVTL
ncbi:methionine ABC transporter ATP-binding protein [Leptospira kobayashii]|uniref:methionine ABC transporter ATP-binding protein n=1 Tax=Leptospira kobayashii TaxID=1917830 RepID=UPI001FA7BC5A|nr:ATP-binding cassette domain-containing protein [Leptospira kobayashii]